MQSLRQSICRAVLILVSQNRIQQARCVYRAWGNYLGQDQHFLDELIDGYTKNETELVSISSTILSFLNT